MAVVAVPGSGAAHGKECEGELSADPLVA